MNLIGVTGKMGAGKDLVGEIIQELYPGFEVKKYAGKLKQICGVLCGVDPLLFEDQEFKKTMSPFGMTYRELLQKVGTEGMRDVIGREVWVKALFVDYSRCSICGWQGDYQPEYKCQGCEPTDIKWIITDVRFPNEADAIKYRRGVMIQVIRESSKDSGNHSSETAMDNYSGIDFVVDNNGTKEELKQKVKQILEQL